MGICVIANAATSYLVAFLKTVGITLTQGDVSNPNYSVNEFERFCGNNRSFVFFLVNKRN